MFRCIDPKGLVETVNAYNASLPKDREAQPSAYKLDGVGTVQANGTMGQREPVKDMARILGRWVDGMAARVFAQATVDELAEYSPDILVPDMRALRMEMLIG